MREQAFNLKFLTLEITCKKIGIGKKNLDQWIDFLVEEWAEKMGVVYEKIQKIDVKKFY